MSTKVFYHFTCLFHLPGIVKEGLNEGELALTEYKSNDVVSLTKSPIPTMAFWSGGGGVLDKLKVRIAAQVEPSPKLMRWRDAIRKYGCRPAVQKALDPFNDGHNWMCHFGTIPPSELEVAIRTGETYDPIGGMELSELAAKIQQEKNEKWDVFMSSNGLTGRFKSRVKDSWLLDGSLREMFLADNAFSQLGNSWDSDMNVRPAAEVPDERRPFQPPVVPPAVAAIHGLLTDV